MALLLKGDEGYYCAEVDAGGARFRVRELNEAELDEWDQQFAAVGKFADERARLERARLQDASEVNVAGATIPLPREMTADEVEAMRDLSRKFAQGQREMIIWVCCKGVVAVARDNARLNYQPISHEDIRRLPNSALKALYLRIIRESVLTVDEQDFLAPAPSN